MLEVDNLQLTYRSGDLSHHALKGVSLSVGRGEFFTLLGPSGCGKTTCLRSIAGLENPDTGRISIHGTTVFKDGASVPIEKRDIAMVFQSYAVWPHMTVAQNVSFPLEMARVGRAERDERVRKALAMVGLEPYADRSATMLSGGQQQRVALARALVKNAKLILLDEPLSNLDAKLRDQMRVELRELQQRIDTTAIYVTHDQDEAMSMSDRVALMRAGELIELGNPAELYLRPRHRFTAEFLGQATFLPARFERDEEQGAVFSTALGTVVTVQRRYNEASTHTLAVRPEHVHIGTADELPDGLDATVVSRIFSGRMLEYVVRIGETVLPAHATSRLLFSTGDRVKVSIAAENWIVLED